MTSPFERPLAQADPEVASLIRQETERQASGLELIASENFVSEAVMEATGSPLTNKYAEGLPGKRYYGGWEGVGKGEQLAIDPAQAPFRAPPPHAEPPPGAPAKLCTDLSLLAPGAPDS